MSRLFVYGSLSEGMVHFNKLADFVKEKRTAVTKGSMYRLDVGYPVFLQEGETRIEGTVVDLNNHEALFPVMDEFHGCSATNPEKSLYNRVEISIEVDGNVETAWIYSMNPKKLPSSAQIIENGDWKTSLTERAPMTDALNRSQKLYIRELGKSTGRNIVPIKLDLYRELMNKGLIVDKGRRLALTSLGQEVYRFLGDF